MALLLALLVSQWAGACSLAGLAHEITFSDKQDAVSATQVRSITDWYVDLRNAYSQSKVTGATSASHH